MLLKQHIKSLEPEFQQSIFSPQIFLTTNLKVQIDKKTKLFQTKIKKTYKLIF